MSTTYVQTIDNLKLYAERSVQDKDGNQIDTTYAKTSGLATVATTGAYSDLSGAPTIPTATSDLQNDSGFITLADVPAQVNADWDATSGDPGFIENKPVIPDPLPDMTGHAGDVLTVNSGATAAEWTTPSSGGGGSKFFAEAMYKSFDDSLHAVVPGMAIEYNKTYNQALNAIVLEFSWYNDVPVFGRTVAKHLSKFADNNGEIVLVSNQSQDNVDVYPVWLPCTSNSNGFLTPVSTNIYLKYKNTVRFGQSSTMVYAYIADGTRAQWSLRRAATVKVPMTYGLGFDDTIFEQVGDWSSITEAPVEKWVLAFRNSSNTNWITLNAATSESYSGFCIRFPYNVFDVKVWSGKGLGINPYNGLYVTHPLPSSGTADENKVLTVNSSGSPEWVTPSGGGSVTDVEVNGTSVVNASGVAEVAVPTIPTVDQTYNAASTNAQSGTAVAGAISTKEDAFTVGDGLEMVSSGGVNTLQVEAPVDIVAGTGIAIDNPDGNTMRITNTGFPISATDAVLCGTFKGDPMYTKTYTFTGTVGTSETTISMTIDEKKGTDNINRIWIDPSASFIAYGSAGNNFLPISWRLGSSRQGSVAVLGASTGSLSCRCIDTSSTPIALNITIRYTVSNA